MCSNPLTVVPLVGQPLCFLVVAVNQTAPLSPELAPPYTYICQHVLTHACMHETARLVGVSSAVDSLLHLSKPVVWRERLWMAEFKPI